MIRPKLLIVLLIVSGATLLAQRTKLSPGRNSFSPEEDVKIGREVAKEAEQQLVLINHGNSNTYISALGQQLVSKAPNEYKFPFYFKMVDDRSINAFALPGGPIYIHRGAIEAADNESQLAGVVAHEIAHIVLRHGTNQATKGQLAQSLGALAEILGGDGAVGQVIGAVGGFAANSVLLRYSRDAETQADLMGTQILYDMGYEPRGMAQFFEKLAKEHKGSKAEQFFSNHPIPENRVINVNDEIRKIGPPVPRPRVDSPDFQDVKKVMLSLAEPPKPPAKATGAAPGKTTTPPPPSSRMVDLQISGLRLRHPENWKPSVQGSNVTLAPQGGEVGQGNLAYGLIVDVFTPQNARNLDQATTQFLDGLKKGNPAMKVTRSRVQTRVDGQPAQITEVSNESPLGGQETDVIVTLLRSNGELLYFVQVAPAKEFTKYQTAFRNIMDSVRLR